jgi:hypothetical protein
MAMCPPANTSQQAITKKKGGGNELLGGNMVFHNISPEYIGIA